MSLYEHDNLKLAEDYDRLSVTQLEAGKRLVERMALPRGATILDVGCGTGRLAQWMAEHSELQANVVGIEPLSDRIRMARARLPGGHFELGSAEDLGMLAAASFGGACLSAVFHWITDKPKALAEIARVLRPGGRLGLTTTPKELHGAGRMAELFQSVFSLPHYRGRIRLENFALHHQSVTVTETITMLLAAGFSLTELHVVERVQSKVSARDMLDFIEASSFGNFLTAIPEDLHAAFRADFERALDAFGGPDGFVMRDYGMLLVAAKRPPS